MLLFQEMLFFCVAACTGLHLKRNAVKKKNTVHALGHACELRVVAMQDRAHSTLTEHPSAECTALSADPWPHARQNSFLV